jgi:hypoxanthine phosphoribosyltransferase
MSEKFPISFQAISEAIRAFSFPETDLVIGIGRGGVVPACLIAHQLEADLKIVRVSHRDDENKPKYKKPVIIGEINWDFYSHFRILIVDDVSVTGKTLQLIRDKLLDHKVTTFVLKGEADLVLFPDVKSCVAWPWKINKDDRK